MNVSRHRERLGRGMTLRIAALVLGPITFRVTYLWVTRDPTWAWSIWLGDRYVVGQQVGR